MQFKSRDKAYLWDMLDASRAIAEFIKGKRSKEYLTDRMLRGAVERHLEIIGEAAKRVSEAFQKTHSEIPWKPIIAQRNVLAHEYGEIRHDRVWTVCVEHIPKLICQLESLDIQPETDS